MKLPAFVPAIGGAAPLVDHLWQSTLVALLAVLVAFALRRHRAGLRYWVWFAASMKFLLPFTLLVRFGQILRPAKAPSAAITIFTESWDYFAQPFSPFQSQPAPDPSAHLRGLLPYAMLTLWVCGALAVLFHWARQRRRVQQALQTSSPSTIAAGIPVRVTASTLEPGVFGLFRPVLLLPTGIAERLTQPELRAIVAHEMCHVRRRDNLTSAAHMLVEALFWFHPLVWWMGARLIDERERACDEHVLAIGSDPQLYAESILKVCNFYLESPLFCAAGVTGSHLKKRIEAIMSNKSIEAFGFGKRGVLFTLAASALVGPFLFGFLHAPASGAASPQNATAAPLAFATASVKLNTTNTPMAGFNIKGTNFSAALFKPDRFLATNFTLGQLLRTAYQLQEEQLVGAPNWADSEKYDVDARIGDATAERLSKLESQQSSSERLLMLQSLLADQFKLVAHRETKMLPVYILTVADKGAKLRTATPDDTYPNGPRGMGNAPAGPGHWEPEHGKEVFQGVLMSSLVQFLSNRLHRMVLDNTGLTARYDFTLQWAPISPEASSPSIVSAVRDQLGLQLERKDRPVEVLVVDHAEQPK